MKFIIVAIIVSAFALSFSSGLHSDFMTFFFRRLAFKDTFNNYTIVRKERIDFSSRYGYMVGKNYFDTQTAILEAWRKCDRELFLIPMLDRSLDIFDNPSDRQLQNVTEKDKCLYYCMMSLTGVLTDEGFEEEIYMDYIRKLRFNSTPSGMEHMKIKARRELSDTINNLTGHLNTFPMYQRVPRSMNDIIELYAQAARECKSYGLRKELDNCAKADFILRCMMEHNRKIGVDTPFYPLWMKDFWDSSE